MIVFDKKTTWWVGAVISPFALLIIGFLVASATPGSQDDWFGMHALLPIFGGLFLGCLLSFVFTVVSIAKKEEGYFHALLVSVPALIFVLYQVAGIAPHR